MEENLWKVLEKEGLFHSLLENAYDAIFIIDSKGNFIEMNKAAEELTGYLKQELIGKSFLSLHPEKEHKEILSKFKKAPEIRNGIMNSMELTKKDKTPKYVDINASFVRHGDKNLGIAILRDVTEKKEKEEKLKESEEKFQKAFMKNPYSGVIISIPEGKIIEGNEAFEKNSGYSKKEAVDKTSIELNLWKNPKDYNKFIETFNKNGCVKEMKFKYLTKDKKETTSLISAEKIELNNEPCIICFTKNITKEVEQRKKLKESEKNYKETLDLINIPIHVVDKNLTLTFANKEFMKWCKQPQLPENIVGKKISQAFPFLNESLEEEYKRVFKEGKALTTEETTKIEGQEIKTQTCKIPIFNKEKVERVVTIIIH